MNETQFHKEKLKLKNKIDGKKWLINYQAEKIIDPTYFGPKIITYLLRKLLNKCNK